jgi:hypothetical protein
VSAPAKLAVALGIALLLALAGVAVCSSKLVAERAAHDATRTKYASEKAWWLYDQRSANATIGGLSLEAGTLLRNREAERKAEVDRFDIFFNLAPAPVDVGPRPAPAATPSEVVNDTTSKAAVRHINDAFVRVGGLRDAGR